MKHNTCPPCSGNCDQGRACPGIGEAKAAPVRPPLRYLVNASAVKLSVCAQGHPNATVRAVSLQVGRLLLGFIFGMTR